MNSKQGLFTRGLARMTEFCTVNNISVPTVQIVQRKDWRFNCCAYYRPTEIKICLEKCAAIGVAAPAWSYPGNTVDRTPFGVLQHELGHHVDVLLGKLNSGYKSEFSITMRRETGEAKLTNYCLDDGEWFAEMFRLFVTNPNLLSLIRPNTYAAISAHFRPVEIGGWNAVLASAPERIVKACANKISMIGGAV